jgi:hypothetical protein
MRRFAWIRLLLPGLCAGVIPACFSPGASQLLRSSRATPGDPVPTANAVQQVARPATPDEHVTRAEARSDYERPAVPVVGVSAAGLPLRPRQLPPDKPQPVLLASAQERKVLPTVTVGVPRKLPKEITEESALLTAMRCFIEKHPKDGAKELSKYDDSTREILMTLMPLTVRVGEDGIEKADPKEIAVVVDQLQGLLWNLRPKAALVMDKCCFCREIRRFGVFEALEARPTFQPGQMVEVYAEVRNVKSHPYRSRRGDYRTHLRSALDIRRPSGEVVWPGQRFDKPDDTLTPQHDYFQHYRLQVPPLDAGPYVLHLEVIDVPTGRTVRRDLEFTIGPSGGPARSD